MESVILLFVKYPHPGAVKTRLAQQIGAKAAAEAYRTLAQEVCERVSGCGKQMIVFADPAGKVSAVRSWLMPLLPPDAEFQAQSSGDLGARLSAAFSCAFSLNFRYAAAIGSDCIELTPAIFEETWKALRDHDVVLGPASDGGYYLIALREAAPQVFESVSWGSRETLRETLDRAAQLRLRVHLLPELSDVDTEEDWRVACKCLSSSRSAAVTRS